MQASRANTPLPEKFGKINLFTDLSSVTMFKRCTFAPITAALRAANIPYKGGLPVKLMVKRSKPIFSPEDGKRLLQEWNIPVTSYEPPTSLSKVSPKKLTKDWSSISRPLQTFTARRPPPT
ncbi:Hypothetical predicted protein [Pelobates cultripes]|uniref:Uncharacterized protein n=1 Tax=Pelobates cultripes TaxID=61616 RepID=A0AAD1WTF3_PELCU|nr:Hypothetical predicted protein [Pelobates cultripes]